MELERVTWQNDPVNNINLLRLSTLSNVSGMGDAVGSGMNGNGNKEGIVRLETIPALVRLLAFTMAIAMSGWIGLYLYIAR